VGPGYRRGAKAGKEEIALAKQSFKVVDSINYVIFKFKEKFKMLSLLLSGQLKIKFPLLNSSNVFSTLVISTLSNNLVKIPN